MCAILTIWVLGLGDDVSVVLFGFRKGPQYPVEIVGVSSQAVSLLECLCLYTYSLVAGAVGQKIILAEYGVEIQARLSWKDFGEPA